MSALACCAVNITFKEREGIPERGTLRLDHVKRFDVVAEGRGVHEAAVVIVVHHVDCRDLVMLVNADDLCYLCAT